MPRPSLRIVALILAAAAAFAVPARANTATLTSPLVRAAASRARWKGRTVLLVRSLTISEVPKGSALQLGCGGCRRYPKTIRRTTHGTVRSYAGLSWILPKGRVVTVAVTRRGSIGRWMRLVPRPSDMKALVLDSAGCLDASDRHVLCAGDAPTTPGPRTTSTPTTSAPVTGASTPAATTPAPTPGTATTPAPSVPAVAHDPIGKLLTAMRLSQTQVRVTGWARDEDDAGAPVTVKTLIDGNPVDQGVASLIRDDVGAHGFDQIVAIDQNPHTLCVVAVNLGGGSDHQLPGCFRIPLAADISQDGYVGCADLTTLRNNFRQAGTWEDGDINGDGVVDITDLSIMVDHWSPPPGEPDCSG